MDGKLRNMTSVYIRKQDDGVVFIALEGIIIETGTGK